MNEHEKGNGTSPPPESSSSSLPSSSSTDASQSTGRRKRQPFARDQRNPDQPKRVRRGIAVRASDPEALVAESGVWSDLVRSWIDLIDRSFSSDARVKGWRFAQLGQVVSLNVRPGAVDAQIQGFEPRPRRIVLSLPALPDEIWNKLVSAMAGEAIITATLLAGELPETLPAVANRANVPINFDSVEKIDVAQRVPEVVGRSTRSNRIEDAPDEHGACAAYVLAERLRNDPLLLIQLRGLTVQQLLDRLRSHREATSDRAETPVHGEPVVPQGSAVELPLEECVDAFWGHDEDIAAMRHRPKLEYAPHALLRRLGPSPLEGKFPLVGLLASIYDHVSEQAIHLRDGAEHIEEPATDDDTASAPVGDDVTP